MLRETSWNILLENQLDPHGQRHIARTTFPWLFAYAPVEYLVETQDDDCDWDAKPRYIKPEGKRTKEWNKDNDIATIQGQKKPTRTNTITCRSCFSDFSSLSGISPM